MCIMSLCAITAIEAFSQYNPTPDSIIKTDKEGRVVNRSYFKYDAQERQTAVEHYTLNKKTGVWGGTYKENAQYDANGNRTQLIVSYWDYDTGKWLDMTRENVAYDVNGRRLSEEAMTWNKQRNAWIGDRKNSCRYTVNGQRAEVFNYQWDDAKVKWIERDATLSEYDDATRQKKSDTHRVWAAGEWQNTRREEYEYDPQNRRLIQTTTMTWTEGKWVPITRFIYTSGSRNEAGQTVVVTQTQNYDATKAVWVNHDKTTTVLDPRGAELINKKEEWNGMGWQVVKIERTEIEYNNNGDRTHEARYRWNGGNDWIGVSSTDKTYSEYADVLSEIRMEWDMAANSWRGVVNVKTDYDDMGNITAEERYKWDKANKVWKRQSKASFVYDTDHNKTSESTSSWNPRKDRWEEFYKGRFEYRIGYDGNIMSQREYLWEKGEWKLVQTVNYN